MKYLKISILILVCISLMLVGCQSQIDGGASEYPSNDNGNHQSSDQISPFQYDSFADLKKSVSKKNADQLYASFVEEGVNSEQLDKIKYFVKKLQSQDNGVPYLDGKEIKLRNEEGFSNISFFHSELYGLPWIFYHPKVSTGENFYITITYLPENILNEQKDPTASEVIKKLSPNSPNINNLGDQHKSIYNQTLKLSDREVTALVIEYKTDSRNSIFFVYEDLLVQVRCDPEVWNAQWFSDLSFDGFDK